MPATVTLSTTSLYEAISDKAGEIKVASASGLVTGTRLWIDRELMSVTSVGVSTTPYTIVKVRRGVDGTVATAHASSSTVTIGSAEQFYNYDPMGIPPTCIPVSPWINTRNGNVWYAQGDATEFAQNARWWQNVTNTYGVGSLGVRTVTSDPTSST